MNTAKLIALVLIVLGILALVYGGFSYVSDTHTADIGPIHLQVNEREHVYVPIWAGIGAIVGGLLLLAGTRGR